MLGSGIRHLVGAATALAIAGCSAETPPNPAECVGVACGGFAYKVSGRLIDAATGRPVCCVAVSLEAQGPGYPAAGRAKTDNDGRFTAELTAPKSYGTCLHEDGTTDPPPAAPALTSLSIQVDEDAAKLIELTGTALAHQQSAPGSGTLVLQPIEIRGAPRYRCDSSAGSYCPLAPDVADD
jgi:hypothetical protein